MINALKLIKKPSETAKILINGAGAGAISVCNLLMHFGAKDVIMCDTKGAIYKGRTENMNKYKELIAEQTNHGLVKGNLTEAIKGREIFIGLSAAG